MRLFSSRSILVIFILLLVSLYAPGVQSAACSTKSKGDSNCDAKIDLTDFETFRREFTGILSSKDADFNGDQVVSLADFEIWRVSYFSGSSITPTITTAMTPTVTPSVTPGPTGNPNVTILYVGTTGSDTNSGSKTSPLKTITKAISLIKPGQEIHILPGTYKEQVSINAKSGTPNAPIRIVGESLDKATYPVIDGGDVNSTNAASWATDKPAFTVTGSAWWTFERLKIINSSQSSYFLDNSGYITIRRNILDYHHYGVLTRNKSHHILMEYNDIYQSYGSQPWSSIKNSKWEGGAYTSFGGAGYVTIRNNYMHDMFNGVYIFRNTRVGAYMDANVWIYKNKYERILDDPYEPDQSYAYNNHFFDNTLIDTHRLVSMASGNPSLPDPDLGPIYIYNNTQLTTFDITKEASSRSSYNSAWKVELNNSYFTNGLYIFNNSIDISTPVNGIGIHILNGDGVVNNWFHYNNIYKTKNTTSPTAPSLRSSASDYNMSNTNMGFQEANGKQNTDPQFIDSLHGNFNLTSGSPAKGKSKEISFQKGFVTPLIIPAGSDLGAMDSSTSTFKKTPEPKYEIPPGGEDPSFGTTNYPWPTDKYNSTSPF